jgi:hypothetical protein
LSSASLATLESVVARDIIVKPCHDTSSSAIRDMAKVCGA